MSEIAGRLAAAQQALGAAGVDGMIVTNLTNVRYLTGFAGSNAVVCLSGSGPRLLTDFRYAERVASLRSELDVHVVERDVVAELGAGLGTYLEGAAKIGFEADSLPYGLWQRFRELDPAADYAPTSGLIEQLRQVKSPTEIHAIRTACLPLEAIYRQLCEEGLVGRVEADVAWWIERTLREQGFPISFEPIVAAGPNGAVPHHLPGDHVIGRGELVVVDIGAQHDGYASDCTRTLAAGAEPAEDAARDYATVLAAQQAAGVAIRPGAVAKDVDAVARDLIAAAGKGARFGHGLGHGVGLEVHEAPTLRSVSTDVLAPGNVVSNEPGIYEPGSHGVRIEDLHVVTAAGSEAMTHFPLELTVTA